MQDLRVIGVENGALLVVSVEGERYRIPIDEVLQSKLRQSAPVPGSDKKLSPREIQAHIRGGMSAQDVASVTGVPLEYIERFEGPVLAEREYVIESALGVPVHTALETEPEGLTFGAVIEQRLATLGAVDERWASWKEESTGWVVKLSFTADQVDHDARWQFEPKKLALSPMNNEAIQLSQQGAPAGPLIPRLRAVGAERPADTSRFDSGAFLLDDSEAQETPRARVSEPDAEPVHEKNQTADLLEALRRRRGERETASYADDALTLAPSVTPSPDHPSTGSIRLVNVSLDEYLDEPPTDDPARPTGQQQTTSQPTAPQPTAPQPTAKAPRRGRASMPSWDDIVFGARPDDDLA